ncbi:thioredoxin superfamily protein, partial [Trifolium pratense]
RNYQERLSFIIANSKATGMIGWDVIYEARTLLRLVSACPCVSGVHVYIHASYYHDNAFVASRALHIVNGLNRTATFPLLESFFKYQSEFYGAPTRNLSRASIVDEIVKFSSAVVGNSYHTSIKKGFNDTSTDLLTRVSFKYATSRGVSGTPFFYVNGFVLPDTGSALNYSNWRDIIDPLIGTKKGRKTEESLHYFL